MRRTFPTLLIIAIIALPIALLAVGCTKKANTETSQEPGDVHKKTGEAMSGMPHGESQAGATKQETLFAADSLYTCPMHPDVITTDPQGRCPKCGMNVQKLSDEQVRELKKVHSHAMMTGASEEASPSAKHQCANCDKPK